MANTTVYGGLTATSKDGLLIDSGVFFKDFVYGTDTAASALAAGKCIGVTQGGGAFTAIPSMRQIAVDGVKGAVVGFEVIDFWDIKISANILDISANAIKLALGAYTSTVEADGFYDMIVAKNYLTDSDYNTNITFVGKVLGTSKPIIIAVKNTLNTKGISLSPQDNKEGVMALEFKGHYTSADLTTPPATIYYPKTEGDISGTVTDGGAPVEGATVTVVIDSETFTTTTAATTGAYSIIDLPYGAITVTATKGAKSGTDTGTVVAGTTTALGAIAIV